MSLTKCSKFCPESETKKYLLVESQRNFFFLIGQGKGIPQSKAGVSKHTRGHPWMRYFRFIIAGCFTKMYFAKCTKFKGRGRVYETKGWVRTGLTRNVGRGASPSLKLLYGRNSLDNCHIKNELHISVQDSILHNTILQTKHTLRFFCIFPTWQLIKIKIINLWSGFDLSTHIWCITN